MAQVDVEDELKTTLAALVAIDSTSARSNVPMVELIENLLRPGGFAFDRHPYLDDGGVEKVNLVAHRPGTGEVSALALVGHTDCVPFDPSWTGALSLAEREGRLYGRGACDTKAFIACALTAALRHPDRSAPLKLIFTADEEVGCIGSKRLADARVPAARFAIVGEPTSLRPMRAHKGYALAEVEVFGREGHSAYPEVGASAIFRAGRFLRRLEELSLTVLKAEVDARFEPPYTSVNVGLIAGGKAKNIIPGSCRFTVEWRPIPGQALERVEVLLQQISDELRRDDTDFRCEVKVLRKDRGVDTAESSEVVRFLGEESGLPSGTIPFGTEAPDLARLGAEAVVFGPGDIRVAHRTGEYVPVNELVRCAQILTRAIAHFFPG